MITFHKILRGCEEGSREGWRLFLSDYTPIISRLVAVYLPSLAAAGNQTWREAVQVLTANNFERLRSFDHQAEREFLLDLRAFFLEYGARNLDASRDLGGAPRPTSEAIKALFIGVPLAHQQILFLTLAGYSHATIDSILRINTAIAEQGLQRLQAEYPVLLNPEQDVCPWPAAWSEVLRSARASRTESCPTVRQSVRLLDGQTGWQDKDPLEQHMSGCLHCLESWTALREVVYWRREAKPCPADEISAMLADLPLLAEARRPKSLLKRMFG